MAPHPRRTITVLEAYPHSSTVLDNVSHAKSDNGMTGPSRAPPNPTQTATQTGATKTNSASPSRTKNYRSTRRGTSSTATSNRSTASRTPTTNLAITSYSSTTTIYTTTSTSFATFTRPEASQSSSTIASPPVHRTRVESAYEIPDPPAWFPYMVGALLAVMMVLAVLFYCVNFPMTGRGISRRYQEWRGRVAERRKERYGYERVESDDEVDGNIGRSSPGTSPTLRQLSEVAMAGMDDAMPTAFTTSANTPGLHNSPTLSSCRRRIADMSLDTGAVAGLGITLDAAPTIGLREQKSFDDSLLRPNTDKPLPPPPRSPARQAIQSARAYLSTSQPTRLRKDSTDLEAAFPHSRKRLVQPSSDSAPTASPGMRVLEMVGGSVECAAEKMSRFIYDSVKGDPEEGLLLPVRDCERER